MKLLIMLLSLLLLTGCADTTEVLETEAATVAVAETVAITETEPAPDPIREMLNAMTLEQRVGQLFLARCNAETAIEDIQTYQLGGFVLFAEDFEKETMETMQQKLRDYQEAAEIPLLLAVDEEGGSVTRISRYKAFRGSRFPSLRQAYFSGGLDNVLSVEDEKCRLLNTIGLNVNLGPVCDLATEVSAFMYDRSLGQDVMTTADVIFCIVWKMSSQNIGSVLKHFPGYGNNADTHTGIAVDSRSLAELEERDLVPFQSGIEADCDAVLVSHTIVEAFDPVLPASLSPAVHDYLRQELDFSGVIMTDDLVMQAITDQYGAGEAAVMAVLAGNDLLCATEYSIQYEAVLEAVYQGRIDIDTLNHAVRNVLEWKMDLGLL
ncbi:MAG: beta-hexosaminidase [Oscillospiraceae bacterium]|nr:beta-hexosaminidase [Oscillospiraceae bacterium]